MNEYELIWQQNNNDSLISNTIENFHYTITKNNNTFKMQEYYKNNESPEFAHVDDIEYAKFLAQMLADDILISE